MTELIFTLAGTLGFVVVLVSFFALGANSVKPPSEIRLRLSSDKDGEPGIVINAFLRSDGTYQTMETIEFNRGPRP